MRLQWYPAEVTLGFDVSQYLELIHLWHLKANRAFAHKVSADFPFLAVVRLNGAYNDALRDVLAPTFIGLPVLRVPLPSRDLAAVPDLLTRHLDRSSPP